MTKDPTFVEHRFKVMGGPARLLFKPPNRENDSRMILKRVLEMLGELESRYSRYIDSSLISQINRHSGTGIYTPIDEETRGLFHFCDRLHHESEGLFDPTAGILNRAWNFKTAETPNQTDIEDLLPNVGWSHVHIDERGISLTKPNSQLDLGGIVKEYAADKVVRVLREMGVTRALVELAGDIATLGSKSDELPWRVGISDPTSPQKALMSVDLADTCLATSGSYQRFIEKNGKRYGHFLNPKTGQPAEGSFSVSVIADTCLMAGSIATVACLKATCEATSWLDASGLPWLMINDRSLSGPIADHQRKITPKEELQQNGPNLQ